MTRARDSIWPHSTQHPDMTTSTKTAPFGLLRWFAGLSAVVIVLIALANTWVVSSFLNETLFQREGSVSRDFVQNVLVSDESLQFLAHPEDAQLRARFQNTIAHLTNMRDVLRTNVYGKDRSMLWSSDAQLIGKRFSDNEELDEAMAGELVVHAGRIDHNELSKREYEGLSRSVAFFVETYIPIRDVDGKTVIGVVELYKAPLALTEAIEEGRRQVALAAVAGALLLYVSLFWLVRRADRTLRAQQDQLREAETMAAVGELAASVAHNIRNPLASIRSSAELSLDGGNEQDAESARDIIREVDRISGRITELLRLSSVGNAQFARVDLLPMLRECVQDHQPNFSQRQQTLQLVSEVDQVIVMADAPLLLQVFHSLLSNASEAMDSGRACVLKVSAGERGHLIEVSDQGAGMAPEMLKQVFKPFFTTKPRGLGLGLTLARRIVERMGGTLRMHSRPGEGTTVALELPKA